VPVAADEFGLDVDADEPHALATSAVTMRVVKPSDRIKDRTPHAWTTYALNGSRYIHCAYCREYQ
jgi:hypothetical protein